MNWLKKANDKLNLLYKVLSLLKELKVTLGKIQESLGRIEARQNQHLDSKDLLSHEFRTFSQWGEDGIIQFLLRHIEVSRKVFVEFGVENYSESNTRFLLVNNNWSGLVIDGDKSNVDHIKNDPIYWRYNLKAVHAFITKENINIILSENGIKGDIGILSVDIDGNDYWVWKEISTINPAIVIAEYNSRFGKDRAVTTPYNENFVRSHAHYSMIYYGASLKALYFLAEEKGYTFVGCNSAGNNAFFVRKDLKPDYIKELTPEEGYVAGKFREARDANGELLFLKVEEEQKILSDLPLVEVK
ncbi:hypothetical protein H6F75_10935 [Nodosilinea sp. FACHB-131]|uniref:hypothetical protein n=1 Tax=Cyanophyceae TaxID=3028117 RepID=UPI0016883FCB|nr:hypothetical protein [Nodosilinea sp. FACHB-131]MBD1874001.1 hypothetical protein [Nodosilinea sp. FACHB-131]